MNKKELLIIGALLLALYVVALAQYVEYDRYYPIGGTLSGSGEQYGTDSLCANLYADSILWYNPADGDSLTDYSGNHMRGTGKENSSAYGIFVNKDTAKSGNGALKFNYVAGTDSGYLVIPDVLQHLRNTIEGTISAWVKTGYISDTLVIFSVSDSAEKEKMTLSIDPKGLVKAILMNSSGQGTGKVHWACSTSAKIDTTDWVNIILTHNNTTPLLYVDGALDTALFMVSTSKTSWMDSLTMLDEAFIGVEAYDSLGHIHPFNGFMDEIIIEKKAWTAAEVAAYYAAPGTYNTNYASTTENVTGWLYFTQFDPGYEAMRRARTVQDIYANLVMGFRSDTTGTPPNIRWIVQAKDTLDVNTWTDVSDSGYSHSTVLGDVHFTDDDTLKGFLSISTVGKVPLQFRAKAIVDTPNVAWIKWKSETYLDVRYKTTE